MKKPVEIIFLFAFLFSYVIIYSSEIEMTKIKGYDSEYRLVINNDLISSLNAQHEPKKKKATEELSIAEEAQILQMKKLGIYKDTTKQEQKAPEQTTDEYVGEEMAKMNNPLALKHLNKTELNDNMGAVGADYTQKDNIEPLLPFLFIGIVLILLFIVIMGNKKL